MTTPSDIKTVPVFAKFGSAVPIGQLMIRTDALPATSNFCFSLGIQALEAKYEPGAVPRSRYIGRYELECVAIVDDESYLGYLNQVGTSKAVPAEPVLHKPDEDGAMHCICDQFQAPADPMCKACPHRERAAARDLKCWAMVMELRSEEGHMVEILPDNVEPGAQRNCAIECIGEWTSWGFKRFEANTLQEALEAAVAEYRAWVPPPIGNEQNSEDKHA